MKKGFTLTELLVVIVIIGILSVIVFPYYQSAKKQFSLQRSANKLAQDIRRAQGMALGAEEVGGGAPVSGYGIYLRKAPSPQTSYILFVDRGNPPDYKYDPGSEKLEEISLESGIKIKSLNGDHLNIIFVPPEPTTSFRDGDGYDLSLDETAIVISLIDESKSKTITVNKAGLISVE